MSKDEPYEYGGPSWSWPENNSTAKRTTPTPTERDEALVEALEKRLRESSTDYLGPALGPRALPADDHRLMDRALAALRRRDAATDHAALVERIEELRTRISARLEGTTHWKGCAIDRKHILCAVDALLADCRDALRRRDAAVPCESCGADCDQPEEEDDHTCRGCGLTVCDACTLVWGHIKDGAHGRGDPSVEIERLCRRDADAGDVRASELEYISKELSEIVRMRRLEDQTEVFGRIDDLRAWATARRSAPTPADAGDGKLKAEVAAVLNRFSAENGSDTPDFVLANFVAACIGAFDAAVNAREKWYGRSAPAPADAEDRAGAIYTTTLRTARAVISTLPESATRDDAIAALDRVTPAPAAREGDDEDRGGSVAGSAGDNLRAGAAEGSGSPAVGEASSSATLASPSPTAIKLVCVGFADWWIDQPGTDTDAGFDQWWECRPGADAKSAFQREEK